MATFEELKERAIDLQLAGDEEGAERLANEAKARAEYEILKERAIDLQLAGDEEKAEELSQQAKGIIAPFEESRLTDIGRGLKAAPVTVAQGIAEFGAAASDSVFGTEYSRPTSDFFNEFRRENDLDPRTTSGEITEELLSFGLGFIPIAGWLGRASSVARGTAKVKAPAKSKFFKSAEKFGNSKTGKSLLDSRAKLIGSTALATAGYEAFVTPDGRPTISDAFDFMPDPLKTVDTTQMSGSELAYNRLKNKFRRGIEGGLASGFVDLALPVVGAGARELGALPYVSEGLSKLGQGAQKYFGAANQLLDKAPLVKPSKQKLKEWFSPTALADADIMEEAFDVKAVRDTAEREAFKYYKDFEKATGEFFKISKVPAMRRRKRNDIKKKLYDYLIEGKEESLEGLSKGAKKAAERMFRLDQEFQDKFILELEKRTEGVTGTPLVSALNEIKRNRSQVGGYLRRRFEMYDRPDKFYDNLDFDSKIYQDALKEMKDYVRKYERSPDPKQYEQLFGEGTFPGTLTDAEADAFAERKLLSYLKLDLAEGVIDPKSALELRKNALKEVNNVVMPGRVVSLVDNMLIERVEELNKLPKTLELMGEIKDPQTAFIRTISDLAQTTAGLKFYEGVAKDISEGGFSVAASTAFNMLNRGQRPAIIRAPKAEPSFSTTIGGDERPLLYDPETLEFEDIAEVGTTRGVSGVVIPKAELSFLKRLQAENYVKLEPDKTGKAFFGGAYADLSDMYVTPEVKQALTTPARMGLDELGQAIAIGALLKGQAQRMTIVPNIISQARNISGNVIAVANNGNFTKDSDFIDAFRVVAANVDLMDDEAVRKYSRELGALGVMDTSLVTSALRDFKEMAQDFKVAGRLQTAVDKSTSVIPFMQQLESFYSDSDSFFKMMSVFAEQAKVTNALGKANLDINALPPNVFPQLQKVFVEQGIAKRGASLSLEQSPANFLLTMSGDIVKDTMPVYSRVGKAIRRLDAIPVFGNFTSFASENIRNSANTLARGIKELSFKIDPNTDAGKALIESIGEENAKILERRIHGIGTNRLTSYVATSAILPAAMTKASMLATGTTEQEMNAALTLTADFYDGHQMIVLDNDKRGKISMGDLSFIFPHAFVLDPARAALRTYFERGELGKGEADQILNSAWSAIEGYAEPFLSESLIYERVRDVLPQSWIGRDGETQTGSKVYVGSDSFGTKMQKSLVHIAGTYIPGYGRMFQEERSGKFQEGRLLRAIKDQGGTRGQEYAVNEELARVVTGLTPINVNTRTDFEFQGGEYLPLRSSAKGSANREIKRADATIPEVIEGWNTYLDNLYREQSNLYYKIEAARAMGASDQSIRAGLKKSGMGGKEINVIMRGEFWPGLASQELIKDVMLEMRSEDKKYLIKERPWGELNRLSNERRLQKLQPLVAKEERDARLAERRADRARRVAEATPVVTTPEVEQPQAEVSFPQAITTPVRNTLAQVRNTAGNLTEGFVERAQTIAPSVFGDPASQSANLEIQRRSD